MNPIPGPLLLLVLPLAAAVITYLIRRWSVLAALVASTTTATLAFLCLRLPLDRSAFVLEQVVSFGRPVVILGQTLQLEPAGQLWLAFIFLLACRTQSRPQASGVSCPRKSPNPGLTL